MTNKMIDGKIVPLTGTEQAAFDELEANPLAPTRDQVNTEEFCRIASGLTFGGTLFDYDDIAKHRISGAATWAGLAVVQGGGC